ncbi:SHOCT domain-containing protein [Streptacidiphilus sp. EB129]|uniref:SHOCT domain-containing protein n=1 Tax=Streptacidiphilus sp. EB129 TaxID=3156262 RepID=UPI003514F5B4
MYRHHHMGGWGGWGGWGLGLFALLALLVLVCVVLLTVAVVRYLGRSAQHRAPQPESATVGRPTPEQLLAERFARGEIDDEEYRQRLETLRRPPDPPGS